MTDIAELAIEVDSRDVKTATKHLDSMDAAGNRAMQSTSKLGKSVKAAGVASATAFAALSVSAVRIGTEFDASMNNVQSKLGISGEAMIALRDQAAKLGATTAFSASQAA